MDDKEAFLYCYIHCYVLVYLCICIKLAEEFDKIEKVKQDKSLNQDFMTCDYMLPD